MFSQWILCASCVEHPRDNQITKIRKKVDKYAFPARAREGFVSSDPSKLSVRTHHSRRGGGEKRTTRERQFVRVNLRGNLEFLPAAQEVKWHCRTALHHLKSPATTNETKGSRGGGGWNERGKKIQISNSLSHLRGGGGGRTERGEGGGARLSLRPRCQMAWAGWRAGGDRVKTIQSQRGIGSDKERRGGTEGDKQINLQSEWGGLPRLPSSLLLYLALPPSRDCARSGGAACQKLFSAMALRSSPVAAKRGRRGRNPQPALPPSLPLSPAIVRSRKSVVAKMLRPPFCANPHFKERRAMAAFAAAPRQ